MRRTAQVKMDGRGTERSIKPVLFLISLAPSIYHELGSGDQGKSITTSSGKN
jgi:hypothetical protein